MNHPDPGLLQDHVDERLGPTERRDVDQHLALCASCREELNAIRRVVAGAAALPRGLPVPDGLWNDVRSTIDAGKVLPLPTTPARSRPWSPRALVAAATALVVLSSGTTALLLRPRVSVPGTPVATMLPAAWLDTEAGYLDNVAALRHQLDAQRNQLDPATIAVVERAMASIDAAIAEARAAMVRDPGNAALADLLASNYRQKVELLRRATQFVAL